MVVQLGTGGEATRYLACPIPPNAPRIMKAPDDLSPEPDPHGCEYMAGWAFLNALTGETVPARCGRNRCAYCLRVNARRRARAIAWAGPERAILLTLVGDDWQTVRPRMYRCVTGSPARSACANGSGTSNRTRRAPDTTCTPGSTVPSCRRTSSAA